MSTEKTIVIDIKLTRGLAIALTGILMTFTIPTFWMINIGIAKASADAMPSAPASLGRQFYLAKTEPDGDEALKACANGYHFASIWEIADPSNLIYNTTLGQTLTDSGAGPPSLRQGWIRTGYSESADKDPGHGNCKAWTTDFDYSFGTRAALIDNWDSGLQDVDVWKVTYSDCHRRSGAWCVED